MGTTAIMTAATKREKNYYEMLLDEDVDCKEENDEISCFGAGIQGGFKSSKELHVMKYKQAMKTPDKDNW
jgi:hypothetical protein